MLRVRGSFQEKLKIIYVVNNVILPSVLCLPLQQVFALHFYFQVTQGFFSIVINPFHVMNTLCSWRQPFPYKTL